MKQIVMVLALTLSPMAWAGRAEDNKALMDAAFANQQKLAEIDARMLTDKATAEGEAKRAQAEAMGQKATAAMNACANDPNPLACVAVVQSLTSAEAMMAQMADAMKAMAAADSLPQRQAIPIPYRRDMGAIFRDVMTPVMPFMGQVAGGMERVRLAESSERLQVQQYQTFGSIATTAIAANAQVTTAAVENAQPVYNVGGNLGDTYGANYTGGDRAETNVGGDQIGGDRVEVANSGIIGDGNEQRQDSDNWQDVGNCYAGNGANGATGGAGGYGSTGTGNDGSATGGNGAVGGSGGDGGACSGGRP